MSDYFPVLLALLFVVVIFIVTTHRGIVGILASGLSLALGAGVFALLLEWLPAMADTHLGLDTGWKFTATVSAVTGLCVFVGCRIVLGLVLKRLFNPDKFLHRFVDGIPGGILSLLPSLIGVVLFFLCVRGAGTIQELNYVDTLSQDGIGRNAGSIPRPPASIRWRNAIETLPFAAPVLDSLDPFSRRSSRHVAALVLISRSRELRSHLLDLPETGELVESPRWTAIAGDGEVSEALEKRDRFGLVLSSAVQSEAADPDLHRELGKLILLPALEQFVASLAPLPEPDPVQP